MISHEEGARENRKEKRQGITEAERETIAKDEVPATMYRDRKHTQHDVPRSVLAVSLQPQARVVRYSCKFFTRSSAVQEAQGGRLGRNVSCCVLAACWVICLLSGTMTATGGLPTVSNRLGFATTVVRARVRRAFAAGLFVASICGTSWFEECLPKVSPEGQTFRAVLQS